MNVDGSQLHRVVLFRSFIHVVFYCFLFFFLSCQRTFHCTSSAGQGERVAEGDWNKETIDVLFMEEAMKDKGLNGKKQALLFSSSM